MRRALAWLVTLVLAAGGTLAAHGLAYRLTGRYPGDVHTYLTYAPQLLALLATLALGLLALARGAQAPRAWPFPVLAVVAFVAQEHVERVAHGGELPWLLTEPTFLLGLALQLPIALAAWVLARALLRALATAPVGPRGLPAYELALETSPVACPAGRPFAAARARAPPVFLHAC